MGQENYFFDTEEKLHQDKVFVLIIYDISGNKKRLQLSKLLQGYGFRIQKSAFEAVVARWNKFPLGEGPNQQES